MLTRRQPQRDGGADRFAHEERLLQGTGGEELLAGVCELRGAVRDGGRAGVSVPRQVWERHVEAVAERADQREEGVELRAQGMQEDDGGAGTGAPVPVRR
jgi:hypothetical protein